VPPLKSVAARTGTIIAGIDKARGEIRGQLKP